MGFQTRLIGGGTIEEREAEYAEERTNTLADVMKWDDRLEVKYDAQVMYIFNNKEKDECLGWVYLETMANSCGMCFAWGLNDRKYLCDKNRMDFLLEIIEKVVRKAHHGLLIYGLNDNQAGLEEVLRGRGFTESAEFCSPRTGNICKLLVKDLTK